MLLLSEPLTVLLVAEPYQSMTAAILPFAAIAGAMRAFREHGPDQSFLICGRPRLVVGTSIVEAGLTLVLCLAGLAYGGVIWAAAGCAAASALAAAIGLILARSRVGYALPAGDAVRVLAATAAMAGALLALPPASGLAGVAAATAAGAAVYFAALGALYAPSLLAWRARRASAVTAP